MYSFFNISQVQYLSSNPDGSNDNVSSMEDFSMERSQLKSIKEGIKKNLFNDTFCTPTAYELINYICGDRLKYGTSVPQTTSSSISYFLQVQAPKNLFNDNTDETIFLLDIENGFHTFVIEKIIDIECKYLVYQCWFCQFTLDWWLGNDKGLETNDFQRKEKLIYLRENFGKGKELSKEEIKNFISTIALNDNQGITISGYIKQTNNLEKKENPINLQNLKIF